MCTCVYACGVFVCQDKKCNQTKSVKSSTVDTSLFLCPEVSGFAAASSAETTCSAECVLGSERCRESSETECLPGPEPGWNLRYKN